jgi:hypothetical protein
MVAMSDFSTFSQMTWTRLAVQDARGSGCRPTYGNAVVVLLADALCLGLALLEGVLVLKLGSHGGGCVCVREWLGVEWVRTGQKGASGVARQRLYGWKRMDEVRR